MRSWMNQVLYSRKPTDPGYHRSFTLGHIQAIRAWLLANGFENILVMERINGKNVVYIQILLTGGPVQIEAAWLNTIHRKTIPHDTLVAMLTEKAKELVPVRVA